MSQDRPYVLKIEQLPSLPLLPSPSEHSALEAIPYPHIVGILAVATQIVCIVVLALYNAHPAATVSVLALVCDYSSSLHSTQPSIIPTAVKDFLPSALLEPSPAVFVSSVMFYSSATLLFYDIHANDRYQPHTLALGALAGIGCTAMVSF